MRAEQNQSDQELDASVDIAAAAAAAQEDEEPATSEPGDLFDSHGYPTDEALERLARFEGTPAEYVAYAESLWVNGAGVTIEDISDRWQRTWKRVTFVTGGWSGCEDVISQVEHSMFSFRFKREWKSGGYWMYEIPTDQWDSAPSFLGKLWVLAEQQSPTRGMHVSRIRPIDTALLRHVIDLLDNDQTLVARQRLVEASTAAERGVDLLELAADLTDSDQTRAFRAALHALAGDSA
ncbi:hypothetical protein [Curtobacterium sp. MCBD17_040]|uniref:hypothetical protein n=1 Tax=Curtobacterium sp. MCBD17_040 TaxID=2175674 RepID=UPI000DA8DE23|nr:hypothetical protein [Curtobacterium sp. MCBD17_040]WIB65472.1 hypothetical protein DEI94_19050 [Curtobacterium sp. MCBD17_040]